MQSCFTNPRDNWVTGGIGRCGCHFTTGGRSLSGCSPDVEANLHRLADGGVFIDNRPIADTDAFVSLVLSGPMLGTELAPGTVDRFSNHDGLALMYPGLSGGFDVMAAQALADHQWRGFDKVALDIYVGLHLAVGSRIGRRVGDEMHWTKGEETTVEAIVSCTCWKSVCISCHKLRHYVDTVRDGMGSKVREVSGPDDHCPACKARKEAT